MKNRYYRQEFEDIISESKSLSIGFGLLQHVYFREELSKGDYLFLGKKFEVWDENILECLIDEVDSTYKRNFTIDDITSLWNSGDSSIDFEKATIRKKISVFEEDSYNIEQAFFSERDKGEILDVINKTWFGEDYKIVPKVLTEINKGLTSEYSGRNQNVSLVNLDKKLWLPSLKGIAELDLELDISSVIECEKDYYIFDSIDDKRKVLQNLEEQLKRKYNLLIDNFSSRYYMMRNSNLRAPLTNIPFEFLSKCEGMTVDFQSNLVKIGEKNYEFDTPEIKMEVKSGNEKTKLKQGNYFKVYNSVFVSEFIKFLREDLKKNRTYRTIHYFDFPTRKEIYDNLLSLKNDKVQLITEVRGYNNKIILAILERIMSSCYTSLSKMDRLRQIYITFFGGHYECTFNKYYKTSDKFPSYIMENFIFLSGQYFVYTLKNILFETPEDYMDKMVNLNNQRKHQEQLDFFNVNYNYILDFIRFYNKNFIPHLKEIEVGEHIRVSESLQFLVELFHGEFGGKITNYKESRLMAKIIKIEDSFNKIKERLDEEFDYVEVNNGDESLLIKYLENISDKLVKDSSRHFKSFMLANLYEDWDIHCKKGSFYDKFDIEFLKFKAEMENQISNFVEEKQFSDLDKLLLNEYL